MFGDRLRELRKEKNISQEELANLFEVNKSTVSAWEVNKAQPNFDTLIKLANYFNVTPNYLLCFTQDDIDKIEKLKIAMKDAGLMASDDLTIEELEKALKIVEVMRDRINIDSNN